jgi:caa(3)-type oxidase subunit IV
MTLEDVADTPEGHEHADDMNLWEIGGYLLVLTLATFLTLYLPAGVWGRMSNMFFVLLIAVCKATLVVRFFMHFKYERVWKYFLTIPPCVLGVVAVFALLPDIAFHTWPAATQSVPINWSAPGVVR